VEVQNILSDLIKIKSVNPPGEELEVAKYLKRLFDDAGIENSVIESSPGRGNFIASIGDGERRLLYLSHTDVVPATEGWDFDPFSGEIKDGFVHGRGALDCKDLVAAEAFALLYVARNFKLNGRLIFAATADEEAGGGGIRYVLENFRDKLMANFTINEGGGEPIHLNGKVAYLIQVGEKGSAWAKLKSKGIAGHGSIPTLGDNALVKMANAIGNLAQYKPQVVLIPEVRRLLQAIAEMKGTDMALNEENIDRFLDQLGNKSLAEHLRAITRMTISPNVIQGGVKTNVIPDSCQAEIDIRVLPGQDKEYVLNELSKVMGKDIEIDIPNYSVPSFSDSPHYKLIQSTVNEVVRNAACLPYISTGASDSRFLRRIGIPCYGAAIMAKDSDPALMNTVHGKNERVDIESLRVMSQFLIRLAQNYLAG
jgi:acetylornithine deacetylase/succinyl-diaminopimelate desuccinylase-like protein